MAIGIERLVTMYCDAWNATDPASRSALLETTWAPAATYTDPTVHLAGHQALSQHIATSQSRRPDAEIQRVGPAEHHHEMVAFRWQLVDGAGQALRHGIDFGRIDTTTRFMFIVGFFELLPSTNR